MWVRFGTSPSLIYSDPPRYIRTSNYGVPATNSDAALQSLFDLLAPTGGVLIIDTPIQLTGSGTVSYTSRKDLIIECVGDGVIDCRLRPATTNRSPLRISGTTGPQNTLSGNLPIGSLSVPASSSQISYFVGDGADVLLIDSNNGLVGDSSGDLVGIGGVSGSDFQLTSRTLDGFLVGGGNTVTTRIYGCPRILIRNLRVEMNPGNQLSAGYSQIGLDIRNCRDVVLEGCVVNGAKYIGFMLLQVLGGVLTGCVADSREGGVGADQMCYGFGIGPARSVVLNGCRAVRCKHGLSSSGSQPVYGLSCYGCHFEAMNVDTSCQGVRTHSSCVDLMLSNCVVQSVFHAGLRLVIEGGSYIGESLLPAVRVNSQNALGNSVLISGSQILGGYGGIVVQPQVASAVYDSIVIRDVVSVYSGGLTPIDIRSFNGTTARSVVLSGNFVRYGANYPLRIASLSGSDRLTVPYLYVDGYYEKTTAGGEPRNLDIDGSMKKVESNALYILNGSMWVPP